MFGFSFGCGKIYSRDVKLILTSLHVFE